MSNNERWERAVKSFINTATQEATRVGKDIKAEGERLIGEMKKPERQQQLKQNLREFKDWAKRTAEDLGQVVDEGFKKAETFVREQTNPKATAYSEAPKPKSSAPKAAAPTSARPSAPKPSVGSAPTQPAPATTAPNSPKAAKKTVGRKPGPPRARKAPAAKKTIGNEPNKDGEKPT